MKSKKQKVFLAAALSALFCAVFSLSMYSWLYSAAPRHTRGEMKLRHKPYVAAAVSFLCPDGQSLKAAFYSGRQSYVELSLPDGRNLRLPQAISASGARYANSDESLVFWNKGDEAMIEENGTTTFSGCVSGRQASTTSSLANPASVNCEKAGGRLQMEKKPDGSEFGLCYFDDNRACEEWAMLRGDCPLGGRKTTGYDTESQRFCAWSGGETIAEPGANCKFKDGSSYLADDFYSGACQPKGRGF